jgi:predicted nucleotidyltransferase
VTALSKTLIVLNQMQGDGVIGEYAIGGAIAAFFYLEPAATFDVDVFIPLEPITGELISLTPIYEYLRARGYHEKDETVTIEEWDVQFIPAYNSLLQEALRAASTIDLDGIATRILSAEHLMAIALQTGRSKDFARLLQFLESGVADRARFDEILQRHGLGEKWRAFRERFLPERS